MGKRGMLVGLGFCAAAAVLIGGYSRVSLGQSLGPAEAPLDGHRPVTIALGEHSAWGNGVAGFLGEDLVIRDLDAWVHFWEQHSSNLSPAPPRPAPHINFSRQVIIAVVQGHQTSGGGPSITISEIRRDPSPGPSNLPGAVTVLIVDDERQGPLDVITNPFHIVVAPKRRVPPGSTISFRHVTPQAGLGVVKGFVFAPANSTDYLGLPDATVQLRGARRSVTTGLDGSYYFLNVEPGDYVLRVDAPPFVPDRAAVTVSPDGVVQRDFFLVPGP